MANEWTQRYTPRSWSCEFGHAPGCANRPLLLRYLEPVIESTYRCTSRSWSSECVHGIGDHERVNLEAVIQRVWRYICRTWLSEFDNTLLWQRSREIGQELWASRWMVRQIWRFYSSVSQLPTVGMWQADFAMELSWQASWGGLIV